MVLCTGLVLLAGCVTNMAMELVQYPAQPQIAKDGTAVVIEDYASLPVASLRLNGPYPAPIEYRGQLGKSNMLVSEPPGAPRASERFFVVGQNGMLYLLDKQTRQFSNYIDFGKVYARFNTDPNLGMGLVSLQFDPAYAKNGKFYTVHTENPAMKEPLEPGNAALPGLDLSRHFTTPPINVPAGVTLYVSIVTEWRDTNIGNGTFEGTAREIIRIGTNFARHPVGDLLFNPLAQPGDADYGNLYISTGDGEAGERAGVTHTVPQRLDALQGKILRITPDIALRPQDMLSANGQYRVPSARSDSNPFVAISGARPEIFAYGLRNPHRISWDPVTNVLLAADIGNHSWEEVNVITKGANYGWAEREGPEQTFVGGPNGGRTASQIKPPVLFPTHDTLVVDGLAYMVDIYATLYVFDLKAKKMLYLHDTELGGLFHYNAVPVAASPTLVGKHIVIQDNQGTALVLEPGRVFRQVAKNRLGTQLDRFWPVPAQETIGYSPPVADGNRLFIRGERYLYCIGEK